MADPAFDLAAEEVASAALRLSGLHHRAHPGVDRRTVFLTGYMAHVAMARAMEQILRAAGDGHIPAELEPVIADAAALIIEDYGRFKDESARKAG